jgi:mono/diheme cytochrome c family protein
MHRVLFQAAAALLIGAGLVYVQPISAADNSGPYAAPPPPNKDAAGTPKADAPKADAAPAAAAAAPAVKGASGTPESAEDIKNNPMPPLERAAKSPKGSLKNPYTDNPEAIAEGKKLYFGKSCNGCHGGGGGGGMCPPLTNTVWVYGDDDDTLFRLITLGTDELKKQGYSRKGTEGVVGPMPPFGELIDKDQDVFKIIAWIRTVFSGGPERRHW